MKSMSQADSERRGKIKTVTGISEIKFKTVDKHLQYYFIISNSDGSYGIETDTEIKLRKLRNKLIKKYQL